MKILFRTTIFLLILFSCGEDNVDGDLLIRIENTSTFDYSEIKVSDLDKLHEFGSLKSGEQSNYTSFDKAYRYAYVELKIDEQIFYIQPIDFVGEEPLKPGKYTYEISATNNSDFQYGRLNMSLKVD